MKVAVLGASPKQERYANKAIRLLLEHGHEAIPVNPAYDTIEGLKVIDSLSALTPNSVDTVTVYMNPARSIGQQEALLALRPRRVIFNPGSESTELQDVLRDAGIEVEEACTLVLLRTNAF